MAILAILAAPLFPVFVSAKHRAVRTTCLSNLRQTGLAIGLYQSDANGLLPAAMPPRPIGRVDPVDPPADGWDVMSLLVSYAGARAVICCPTNGEQFTPRWVVTFAELKESRLRVPDSSNVLIECMHHLDAGREKTDAGTHILPVPSRRGSHLTLRADGNVKPEDSQSLRSLVMERTGTKETWRPESDFDRERCHEVFASEKWPPEWRPLP